MKKTKNDGVKKAPVPSLQADNKRLRRINADLLEALRTFKDFHNKAESLENDVAWALIYGAYEVACAAIARATEQAK